MLAVEADEQQVTTIEGLRDTPIQQAFVDYWAVQCGYCTPGLIMNCSGLLAHHPDADDRTIDLVLLADQPLVTAGMVNELIRRADRSPAAYVAAACQGIARPPVIFDRTLFPELMTIRGDEGARRLLKRIELRGESVPFADPAPFYDVDTVEDYRKLLQYAAMQTDGEDQFTTNRCGRYMYPLFHSKETLGVAIGIGFGILSRLLMMRTDYRQYPTYPHGKIIHLSLGVIAAALGSVAVPALLDKNYTAVTFLSLAAQQFREVRSMERTSLTQADKVELVPRGVSYVEGIAMVFEGRNYLVIFSALVSSLCSIVFHWYWGIAAGVLSLVVAKRFQSGKNVGQIADVRIGEVRLEGPDLYVDSVPIMNVGLEENRTFIRERGFGLVLSPRSKSAELTLANLGQRQAILHNLSTLLGVYRDSGEPGLVPMAKLDLDSGNLAIFILPREKDAQQAIEVMRHVPVLENAVRIASKTAAGGGA